MLFSWLSQIINNFDAVQLTDDEQLLYNDAV